MSAFLAVRHAWRSLRRTPVFTVTAALTLVIGLGASIAIFAIVNGVLLRPLPYGNADRLVGAWHDLSAVNISKGNQTSSTYRTYKRLARSIEGIGIYEEGAVNVSGAGGIGEPQRVSAAFLTADLLPLLEVTPLVGRTFTAEEDLPEGPQVIVISEGMWRSRFGGSSQVLGSTLDVGGVTRQIVGVMPSRFRFPSAETQMWLPLRLAAQDQGGFNYNAIARLKPGITIEDAEREFKQVLPRILELYPMFAPGVSTQMLMDQAKPVPFLEPMHEDVVGGIARTLWMVAAAAGLVLLVACANVANLILVRADGRQRELAVREALGAGRARVMTHFLAESAVLTALAGLVGLGVAWVVVRALVASGPVQIPRLAEVRIDVATVLFAAVSSMLVAVLCSVIPALRIGRIHLLTALREGGRGGTAGRAQHRLRAALVAAQIAIALMVLAGSGLLLRSFQQLSAVKPGFNPENVSTLWLSLPSGRYANDSAVVRFYDQLLTRVAALPGVLDAGMTSRLPLRQIGMNQNPLYPEGDASFVDRIPPLQLYTTTDGGYFRTMGIPLIAGRVFDRMDTQRFDEAIISRRTAEQFWKDSTGQAAIGKRFQSLPGEPFYTVIGVVGDVRDTSLATLPVQTVYFPQVAGAAATFAPAKSTMAVAVRSTLDHGSVTSSVQRIVRELDPTLPTFEVQSMPAVFRASMAQLRFIMLILGAAAGVTLVLGAIGLYGVMAYAVTLRVRELGVRIALGAQPRSVARMMTRQGIGLCVLGVIGGLLLFGLVARFLRAFLYGVAPGDPLTLVAASLLLVAIAALASWVPARRASRVDPADALRAE